VLRSVKSNGRDLSAATLAEVTAADVDGLDWCLVDTAGAVQGKSGVAGHAATYQVPWDHSSRRHLAGTWAEIELARLR